MLLILTGLVAAQVPRRVFATVVIMLAFLELAAVTWRYNPPAAAVRCGSSPYAGGSTRLEIASQRWILLVTSDASWPGWRITWNGARLPPLLVKGAFFGVFLRPGQGVLEPCYRPQEFDLGLALAGGALLALAVGLTVSSVYRRWRSVRPGKDRDVLCTDTHLAEVTAGHG